MKERYYEFDLDSFRTLTQNYYGQQQGWKLRKLLVTLAVIVGVVVLLGPQLTVTNEDMVSRALLAGAGIICAVVPFCVAYMLWNFGKKKYGDPFVRMKDMFLYTNSSGIQFGYHDRYDRKEPQSMQVYQIAYSNIEEVRIKDRMIAVYGRVELVEYSDLSANRIRSSYTNGQLGDFASFAFFDCFSGLESFLAILEEKNVRILR